MGGNSTQPPPRDPRASPALSLTHTQPASPHPMKARQAETLGLFPSSPLRSNGLGSAAPTPCPCVEGRDSSSHSIPCAPQLTLGYSLSQPQPQTQLPARAGQLSPSQLRGTHYPQSTTCTQLTSDPLDPGLTGRTPQPPPTPRLTGHSSPPVTQTTGPQRAKIAPESPPGQHKLQRPAVGPAPTWTAPWPELCGQT